MRKFIVVGLMPFFLGCGMLDPYGRMQAPPGYTNVTFNSPRQSYDLMAMESYERLLSGGVWIYIEGRAGTDVSTSLFLNNETDARVIPLPNGTYKVAAFGYSSGRYEGSVKCGFGDGGQDIVLGGGDKAVAITLSAATCSHAAFSHPDHLIASNQFAKVIFQGCAIGSSWDANYCSASSTQKSLRLQLRLFAKAGNLIMDTHPPDNPPPEILSACVNSGLDTYFDTDFRIPVGNGEPVMRIPLKVVVFNEPDCPNGSQKIVGIYEFSKNIFYADEAIGVKPGTGVSSGVVRSEAATINSVKRTKIYLRDL